MIIFSKLFKWLKLLKINYLSAFLGYGLFLEWVYFARGGFLAVFFLFAFSFLVLRRFNKSFYSFILLLFFLISSATLVLVYDGPAAHFLIVGLSLSFVVIIMSRQECRQEKIGSGLDSVSAPIEAEKDGSESFYFELYRFSSLLVVFFWFLGYFYDRFGGMVFRVILSAAILYFVFKSQIFLEKREGVLKNLKNIIASVLALGSLEIVLILNFLSAQREIKALIFAFFYLVVISILPRITSRITKTKILAEN